MTAYEQGFSRKCTEHGLDWHSLLAKSAQYDPYGMSTGSYGMDPTDNWQSFNPTPSSPSTFTRPSVSHPVDPVKSEDAARNMDQGAIADLYVRAPIMLGTTIAPGLGLAGASAMMGGGETAASLLEGRGPAVSAARGVGSGAATYVGGKVLQHVARGVADVMPMVVGRIKSLFSPAGRAARAAQKGMKYPLAPVLSEQAAVRSGNDEVIDGLKEFWSMLGDKDWSKLSRAERLAIKSKTGWDMTPRGVPVYFPKYNVGLAPPVEGVGTSGGMQYTGTDVDKFLKAYPFLRGTEVRGYPVTFKDFLTGGHYEPAFNRISVKTKHPLGTRTIGAHEVQHAVQESEGWLPVNEFGMQEAAHSRKALRFFEDPSNERKILQFLYPAERDVRLAELRHNVAASRWPLFRDFYMQDANEAGARAAERLAGDPGLWDTTLLEDLYDVPWSQLVNGDQHRIKSLFSPTGLGSVVESAADRIAAATRAGNVVSRVSAPFIAGTVSNAGR